MTRVSALRSSHTSRARLPLQHRGKFLQEVVIAIVVAVVLGRVAVVRDHCGDGGEEAHRGGDEGLGVVGCLFWLVCLFVVCVCVVCFFVVFFCVVLAFVWVCCVVGGVFWLL